MAEALRGLLRYMPISPIIVPTVMERSRIDRPSGRPSHTVVQRPEFDEHDLVRGIALPHQIVTRA